MELSFARKELLSEAAVVAIYFFDGQTSCELVRAKETRPPSVLGPYTASLDDAGRARGITFTLDEVPVGEYVVFVEALDLNGANVGSGCAPGQRVFDREVSRIRVTIS